MNSVIRIALGNLWEHKSKTIILGFLICFGVMLIILGNGFLESTRRGLEKDFRANYCGDIVIHGPSPEKGQLTLFGVTNTVSMGSLPKTPAIPDTLEVLRFLDGVDGIAQKTTVISGMGMLSSEAVSEDFEVAEDQAGNYPYFYYFAGDPNSYFEMFSKMKILEGTFPSRTEPSMLVDIRLKNKFEKYYQIPLAVGDKILVSSFSVAGTQTLREVTVSGFYEQPDPNTAILELCYIDQNTARALADLTYGSVYARELPQTIDTSLSALSEDDLFGSDDLFDFSDSAVLESGLSDVDIDALLGDTTLRDKLNTTDDGAWHYVVLKLDNPSAAPVFISQLNLMFAEKGLNVKAIDWKAASYDFASTADMLSGIFTILIMLLAVVVFIVIMNTLIVSVIERTGEIGTMRALGAGRGFIRKLFFTESISITLLASITGTILALIVSVIVNGIGFSVSNTVAKLLLGGGSVSITPTASSILATVIVILIGSAAANLYPVSVALKITPLKAMNQQS
jgi:putative ABC transport system permease protein